MSAMQMERETIQSKGGGDCEGSWQTNGHPASKSCSG